MDSSKTMQGKPLPHGPRSTKVTEDPEASRNPITEPAGPVSDDSLAAESATHGGSFAENRGSQPVGATASQAAMNTTDTSGASELSSVPVGGLREDRERKEKYPEALGGQGDFAGAHDNEGGYVGGPTAEK